MQMGTGIKKVIQQADVYLPYFHYKMPVLLLADGTIYIPVRELCRMLGLRADRHIPKWRKLVFGRVPASCPFVAARKGRGRSGVYQWSNTLSSLGASTGSLYLLNNARNCAKR